MPFVTVQGIPANSSLEYLERFEIAAKQAVCSVTELGLEGKEDEVAIILIACPYPPEIAKKKSILIELSGLRDEPERTLEVRKDVAAVVGKVGDNFFPLQYVACRVTEPYNYQDMPFWDNE